MRRRAAVPAALLAALLLGASPAAARDLCAGRPAPSPPAGDLPDAEASAALAGCNSEALYYGIGIEADPEAARRCAFLELADGRGGIAGAAMLMTIYANGRGAARDLELAAAFACRLEAAPAETAGRLEHLAALKAAGERGDDFHFCDDITSGYAMGLCAAQEAAVAEARRAASLQRLAEGWSAADRQGFAALRDAATAYFEASVAGEVDLSGTARAAFQIEQRRLLEETFVETLEALEAGQAPAAAAGFAEADDRLNAVYRRVMARRDPWWGTVTQEGIRAAQRAWIGYRDAWTAFAARRYPAVPAEALEAWLSERRTALLEPFLS